MFTVLEPKSTQQLSQGCILRHWLSSEILPSCKPGSQPGSPSLFLGQGLLEAGGRRAGSSAAHVSQCEPKCGSLQGFYAGDV